MLGQGIIAVYDYLKDSHKDAYGKPEYQNFENLYGVYPAVEDYMKLGGNAAIEAADFVVDSAQALGHILPKYDFDQGKITRGNVFSDRTKTTLDAGAENMGIYANLGFDPMKDNVLLDGEKMDAISTQAGAEADDYMKGYITDAMENEVFTNIQADNPFDKFNFNYDDPTTFRDQYTDKMTELYYDKMDEKFGPIRQPFVEDRYTEILNAQPGMEDNGIGQFYEEEAPYRFEYSNADASRYMENLELPVTLGIEYLTGRPAYSGIKNLYNQFKKKFTKSPLSSYMDNPPDANLGN